MSRRSSWPFAHMPDAYSGCRCTTCGSDGVCVPVRHEDAEGPGPLIDGAHELLCWPCLGRDGDPLHRYR